MEEFHSISYLAKTFNIKILSEMEVAPRFTLLTLLFTLFTVELLSKIREWMKRLDGLDTGPILL